MESLYFYDLETTGVNSRSSRVMQFAGQRTDLNLKPIGEPHNILIKITEDVLPEPDAVMITGITPQKTLTEGISEVEFLKYFHDEIATPGTIFTGFNTVRFDDEFMRFMHYRNYYDPYEWQWKDNKSRWDVLDFTRMTRALRPEGIEWPFDSKGKPTNRLELLTAVNKLDHQNAHDALSDVYATIAVADMIKTKQPKLFAFLLEMRDKRKVAELVESGKPFLYTSGKYESEKQKTTIVIMIAKTPDGAALVYDLSKDPTPFINMSESEIIECWIRRYDDPGLRLPVKALKYNRCPAIAPLSVLDEASKKRIDFDEESINSNLNKLDKEKFGDLCLKAMNKMNKARNVKQKDLLENTDNVDERLYDGFFGAQDKTGMRRVRASSKKDVQELSVDLFEDERLKGLLPLFKARNFPESLSDSERKYWDEFKHNKLFNGGESSSAAKYFSRIAELKKTIKDPEKLYLLEELELYGQSILPDINQ